MQAICDENFDLIWTIDLLSSTVSSEKLSVPLHMQEHHKETLRQGLWDSTSLLLENLDQVDELYSKLPYTQHYA